MPTFKTLKNLINPEDSIEPKEEPSDIESVQASKERYRPKIPYGYKEEPGLEQPWYSPDEVLATAAAPGVLKAGTSMVKAAPEILSGEGGWLGKEAANSVLAKKLGLKEGDDLVKQGLQKVLENQRSATGLTRQSFNPELSPVEIIQQHIQGIKNLGGDIKNLSPEQLQQFIEINKLNPATTGVFSGANKSLYMKSPTKETLDDYLTTLLHEGKHLTEHQINPVKTAVLPNYGVEHPLQKEAFEQLGLKGITVPQLGEEYFGALENANPVRAAQLNQAWKTGHWLDPRMRDYEVQPAMDYLTRKSSSTLEPHEFEILKKLFPKKK